MPSVLSGGSAEPAKSLQNVSYFTESLRTIAIPERTTAFSLSTCFVSPGAFLRRFLVTRWSTFLNCCFVTCAYSSFHLPPIGKAAHIDSPIWTTVA